MGFFDKFKKDGRPEPVTAPQQAVIVQFNYLRGALDELTELEDQLVEALERAQVGQFDGNEAALDGRDNLLYMYGPDADKIFATIEPVLLMWEPLSEARVLLRYGPPGVETRQKTIVLPKHSGTRH